MPAQKRGGAHSSTTQPVGPYGFARRVGACGYLLLSGGFTGFSGGKFVAALPLIAGFSAINAANEEFQFRNVLVGVLEPLGSARGIALASGFVFGTWHFAGVPGGIVGAVMAGFAGWLWARSMLETRGMLMAWTLHLLQDLVIFAALLA